MYSDDLDKKYYKIREVADILDIPASTLRFWESQFTIIKPHRNGHGTRFYTPKDIEIIRMIHYLVKQKGLKLEAAQEQIRHNRTGVTRRFDAINRLQDIRTRLVELLDALNSRR
jgi:DNA-binding transcriptional MerR regulator